MLLMLMLGQVIAYLPAVDFDLARATPKPRACGAADVDGIVVCARRRTGEGERVPTGPDVAEGLPKAEIGLFGAAKGRIGVQQGSVGGFPSNRVMATIAIPF